MPGTQAARTALSAALVLLASCVTVLAVRGRQKPYSPQAPAFRQKGPAGADIIIVEYSDFQCPACRAAVAPMKDLLKIYGDRVRFIFKHYPLERPHRWARLAAKSTECAGRQGKFWELHDTLYEKQEEWSGEEGAVKIASYAKALKLDETAFAACVEDPAVDALVSREAQEGEDRWVSSTPTFFINGKRFVGAKQLAMRGPPWIEKLLKK
jgi:protein-disulfide isomerase